MAAPAIPFPLREAVNLRGRRVRLASRMGRWPAGLTGEVVDFHPYKNGHCVEVRWDNGTVHDCLWFEYFTKNDFIEYLIEC